MTSYPWFSSIVSKLSRLGTLSEPINATLTGTTLQPVYQVSGALVTSAGTPLTIKYASANVAASQTDYQVVAALENKRIRVLSYLVVCGIAATNITFNSKGAGAGTAISMTHQNAANGGVVSNENQHGWFQTAVGEALTVTTSAGSITGVQITYVEI